MTVKFDNTRHMSKAELRQRLKHYRGCAKRAKDRLDELCWAILGNCDEADEVGGGKTGNEYLRAVVAIAQKETP